MGKAKNSAGGAVGSKKGANADDDACLAEAAAEASAERQKAVVIMKEAEEWFNKQNFGQAVAKFTEALAADSSSGPLYCRRSAAWMAMGKVNEALADAKMGAELGGDSKQATAACWSTLGFVLTRAGSAQAAVDAYEKGLKADPKSKACQQGKEEAKSILERGAGKKTVVAGKDDVEAQELLTLPAPDGVLGKGFEVVKLLVQGQLLTFLLATAVPLECTITPETCKLLGLKIDRTVDLEGVSFESGKAIGTLKECMVHTFVQATVAEKALGAKLHGMLGIPFLKRYDLDLDRVRCEQRFKEAGKAAKAFSSGAMSEERVGTVHMTSINLPGGLFGVPLQVKLKDKATYVLGVVDSSSMFSVLNWKAAEDLGLPPDAEDPIYDTYTKVAGATVDGVAEMPLVNAKVQICRSSEEIGCRLGAISKEEFDTTGKGGGWTLGLSEVADIRACAEFGRVNAAVGDAIQFEMLSDSAVGQFIGGAMLIGQDILAQSPKLTLSAQDRQMWLDPPSRIVDESPF